MVELNINGKKHSLDIDKVTPLLWVLRDTLNMTGTKYSCSAALCWNGWFSTACKKTCNSCGKDNLNTILTNSGSFACYSAAECVLTSPVIYVDPSKK